MLNSGLKFSTSFLIYLEAHLLSESLQISAISRPDKFTLNSPNFFNSSSFSCFAYLWNINPLVWASGKSKRTEISRRDTSAGSKSFFRFVAQITNTSPSLSKLSIFLNKVDRIRLVASWSPAYLDVARESISSIKRITLPSALLASNISASLFSLSP